MAAPDLDKNVGLGGNQATQPLGIRGIRIEPDSNVAYFLRVRLNEGRTYSPQELARLREIRARRSSDPASVTHEPTLAKPRSMVRGKA